MATGILAGCAVASAQVNPPPLSGAESFAVLGASSVANTGASTFSGDVGAAPGGTVSGVTPAMLAPGSVMHAGDAVAAQALHAATAAYLDLAGRTCPPANLDPVLDGASLTGGVYCFSGDAVLNTTLTLTGAGPWIFQVDGALTVGPAATVVLPPVAPATCSGSDVFWQVGDASIATPPTAVTLGAGAVFVGNVLAEGDVSVGAAATVDGRALSIGAGAAGGTVTTSGAAITACSYGQPLPTHTSFKVTGGGSINVPSDPANTDPDATGTGFANYGFNAEPGATAGAASGTFNYVNHIRAANLHVNGPVTAMDVVALNPDGTPLTARISGTCDAVLPSCTFSVVTEDNGEPGRNDRFGVTIVSNGQVVEARSLRTVRNGNIQFHSATLSTTVNAPTLRTGQTMRLHATLRRDKTATPSDAYVVLQLPGGQTLSWTGAGLVPGLVPLARNFVPIDWDGDILALPIPPGAPPGVHVWMSALTRAGTFELLSGISQRAVTIAP
ncbi:MAG: ice-binding family protein [Vicinamibacterales bacterium]